jgi:hypothetical protein
MFNCSTYNLVCRFNIIRLRRTEKISTGTRLRVPFPEKKRDRALGLLFSVAELTVGRDCRRALNTAKVLPYITPPPEMSEPEVNSQTGVNIITYVE